jgi:hypothetical protein
MGGVLGEPGRDAQRRKRSDGNNNDRVFPGTDLGDLNSNWTPFSGDITPHSQEPDPASHDLTGVPKSTGLNPLSEVLELNSVWHFKRIP